MPAWLFWVYARMMPVIQARESIHRVNEFSYAFGAMDKNGSKRFISELERIASRQAELGRKAVRPKSLEDMQQLMGSATKIVLEEGEGS